MNEPTRIQLPPGFVPAGTRLSGIYEIDAPLAKGGMGEVYRGHAIETNDPVAIKLIRADMARRQLFRDGRVPDFLDDNATDSQRLQLAALVALRAGDMAEATRQAEAAEAARPRTPGTHNGQAFDDLRDVDDLLAGSFEVLTTTGKYYWIPTERVISAEFHAQPRTPDTITYAVTTTAPIQIAVVDEIAPYDAVATMMPSPLNCSTRYGISAATSTSATSTPSEGLEYLREKKCGCDISRCAFA